MCIQLLYICCYAIDGCTTRSYYYLGFFYNNQGSNLDISLLLTTTELRPVSYSVYVRSTGSRYSGTVTNNNSVVVYLPTSSQVTSYSGKYYGISLETSSDKVTVLGRSYTSHTTDTYLTLPTIKFNTVTEYTYYAMTVYGSNTYSSILVVGTEDNTVVTLTYRFSTRIYMNYQRYYVYSGSSYSFTINRLQTTYIYPYYGGYDLSGTKIVANKPVSVFSGHRCAQVPDGYGNCGYLIEQIPPTIHWGNIHYTAPLATRRSYTLKVVVAQYNTKVIIYCNSSVRTYTLNEREYTYITLDNQEYCAVHSNREILITQFSGKNGEDPSMGLVSASKNFARKFKFFISTFRYATNLYSPSFVNIIVMAEYYQPDKIYLIKDGVKRSLSTEIWTPITVKNVVEAYATKVAVLPGVVEIIHANKTALMSTMVYGNDQQAGYIHPGGLLHSAIGKLNCSL